MSEAQTTPMMMRATIDVQQHNVLDSVSVEAGTRRLCGVSKLRRRYAKIVLDNQAGIKKAVAAFCDVPKYYSTPALGVDMMLASGNVCDGQSKSNVFVKNNGYILSATKINFDHHLNTIDKKAVTLVTGLGKKILTHSNKPCRVPLKWLQEVEEKD